MSGETQEANAQATQTATAVDAAVAKKENEQLKKEVEELKGANETLAKALEDSKKAQTEFEARAKTAEEKAVTDVETAVKEERTRVAAILELGADYPEHSEVISKCIEDGTSPGDTSTQILKAEAKAKKDRTADHDHDAPDPVRDVHSSTTPSAEDGDFDRKIEAYMKAHPDASYKEAALEVSKQTKSTGMDLEKQ